MPRFKLSIPEIEEIEALDFVSKFIFLTIVRFFIDVQSRGMGQYFPKFTFRLDLFHIHYQKFCNEFKELCELYLSVEAVALSLRKLVMANLLHGGLNQEKNLWEYHTTLNLKEAEELLNYHLRQIPSDEHKQFVLDIAFTQLRKFK